MILKSLLSYFAREKGPHGKMQQHYFRGHLRCRIFLNKALSIDVRCGIIRLISSGILGPTNKVSSVN